MYKSLDEEINDLEKDFQELDTKINEITKHTRELNEGKKEFFNFNFHCQNLNQCRQNYLEKLEQSFQMLMKDYDTELSNTKMNFLKTKIFDIEKIESTLKNKFINFSVSQMVPCNYNQFLTLYYTQNSTLRNSMKHVHLRVPIEHVINFGNLAKFLKIHKSICLSIDQVCSLIELTDRTLLCVITDFKGSVIYSKLIINDGRWCESPVMFVSSKYIVVCQIGLNCRPRMNTSIIEVFDYRLKRISYKTFNENFWDVCLNENELVFSLEFNKKFLVYNLKLNFKHSIGQFKSAQLPFYTQGIDKLIFIDDDKLICGVSRTYLKIISRLSGKSKSTIYGTNWNDDPIYVCPFDSFVLIKRRFQNCLQLFDSKGMLISENLYENHIRNDLKCLKGQVFVFNFRYVDNSFSFLTY